MPRYLSTSAIKNEIDAHLFLLFCRNKPETESFVFCNSTVLHRYQCRQMFGDWLDGIVELSRALQAIDMDLASFACLCALSLVNGKL